MSSIMDFSIQKKARPKIGLTSLIDVIFILIVFFMLVSSFNQFQSIDFIENGSETNPEIKPLSLWLSKDGVLKSTFEHSLDEITSQAIKEQRPIVIHLSEGVDIQTGVDALDELRKKGIQSISLIPFKGKIDAN